MRIAQSNLSSFIARKRLKKEKRKSVFLLLLLLLEYIDLFFFFCNNKVVFTATPAISLMFEFDLMAWLNGTYRSISL